MPYNFSKARTCVELGFFFYYYYLVCEVIGTAATSGLLCQPWVIVKMIVEIKGGKGDLARTVPTTRVIRGVKPRLSTLKPNRNE
jgi:hypothetical protein